MAASQTQSSQPESVSQTSTGDGFAGVPGLTLPVDYELDDGQRFRHGAIDIEFDRMTVREVTMLGLMEALTDKPDWSSKVFDESIIKKWRQEALAMPKVSEKVFDWCLLELQDKAKSFQDTKLVTVLDSGSRCVKSDTIVPTELRDALKRAVQPLLDQQPQDWHPGSNEQVLNLVHPSLYPAVYGKTPVMHDDNVSLESTFVPQNDTIILPSVSIQLPTNNNTWPTSREDGRPDRWSTMFQWLPCDISFTKETDTSVKITSYINNLHPTKHVPLYTTIESLISISIPAWNQVLIGYEQGPTPLRIKCNHVETDPSEEPDFLDELGDITDDNEEAVLAKVREYMALPEDPDNSDDSELEEDEDTDPYDRVTWKYRRIRKVLHPEPGDSYSYPNWKAGNLTVLPDSAGEDDEDDEGVADGDLASEPGNGELRGAGARLTGLDLDADSFEDLVDTDEDHNKPDNADFGWTMTKIKDTFRDSGLQVIVKLASIELTPSRPSYPGGNWHLEGMMNEHIVATSIYYFDVDNISEARIRFRQEAMLDDMDIHYAQDDHGPISKVFGTNSLRDEPAIQEIGSLATPDNRLIAFPNTLQHKVEPFSLLDPTKPGHRRFLVLWLVDPHYKILSTSRVPPQQHEWWVEKAEEKLERRNLPQEVKGMIEEEMREGTMTLDEAKEYRLKLMSERTTYSELVQTSVNEYNFCEH